MTAEFIQDANSIEQIVDGINTAEQTSKVQYFGEYKLDSGEKLAAHYAYLQVREYEHISDDEIKTHLQTLESKGADFDTAQALKIARKFSTDSA